MNFIINDNYILALKVNADGCHLGQLDGPIMIARKKLKNKILGVTCHGSKSLAKNAINILAISTSEIKISVLIDEEHTNIAVKSLHEVYNL